nr:FdtA/QdtA family cupin domain-containing protein [Polynucleobacter tropicus]
MQDCQAIDLSTISSKDLGKLTVIEGPPNIPFHIKRVFYLHDIPPEKSRGSHAHKELHQLLICINGSFDVALDDGSSKKIVHLNALTVGLHIPPMIWAEELNFKPNTICLVLASDFYDELDYYRNYDDFLAAKLIARSIDSHI